MAGTPETKITDADMSETSMCADCLGYGRVDNHTCVYCEGSGRVLTYRAIAMRQLHRERLSAAAPALYEALKELNATFRKNGLASSVYYVAALDQASAALALVDGPTTDEGEAK